MYTQAEMDEVKAERDNAVAERDNALRVAETAIHNAIGILEGHRCGKGPGSVAGASSLPKRSFGDTKQGLFAQADWLHHHQGRYNRRAAQAKVDNTRRQGSSLILPGTTSSHCDPAAVDSEWLGLKRCPEAQHLCTLVLRMNLKVALIAEGQ
jgi:hypothetical protein